MRVIGIAGWSGSGKTTLLVKLIPVLVTRGVKVATLKHAHHAFDVDQEGKDSHAHRMAGAGEVLVASSRRWALMHELRGEDEPSLAMLLGKLSPCDLVLVEGWKRLPHPKIEVHRPALGKPPLFPDDPAIVAVACDRDLPQAHVPVVDLNALEAVADCVQRAALPMAEVISRLEHHGATD